MKKSFFIFVFLTSFICSANLWADKAGYVITNYKFNGVYHSNNTVTVNEIIDVNFIEARHGIYHSIPEFFYMNLPDKNGNDTVKEYKTKITNYSASGDKFQKESEDNNFIFKMGDADRTITGPKRYEFNYTYVFPDDRYKDSDFIYYSVLGSEWSTDINHFEFTMKFENEAPENFQIFSGKYGNQNDILNIPVSVTNDTISGYIDNVSPNCAVTLFAPVPEGYFKNEYNPVPKILEWLFFTVALLYSFWALVKCMNAYQKKPVQTIEFYPPENISSAEVGTIIDNSGDNIDLISLIPWFAHRGYLTISEEGKGFLSRTILTKLKDLPAEAPDYQKTFFNALFSGKNTIDLNNLSEKFTDDFGKAKSQLNKVFTGDKKLYENGFSSLSLGLLSSILVGITIVNDSVVSLFHNPFSLIVPIIAFVMACFKEVAVYSRYIKPKTFKFWIVLSFIVSGIAILIYCEEASTRSIETLLPVWASGILLIINALVNIFEYRNLKASEWNLEMTGKLLGLKEFINTAEMPKLKALIDENPSYFYDILPYAMVFGLTEKWGKQFKNIDVQKPDWYISGTHTRFNPVYFSELIHDGITSTIVSSVAKSTASSSSSGGGFSGGGGGGGGGGSW